MKESQKESGTTYTRPRVPIIKPFEAFNKKRYVGKVLKDLKAALSEINVDEMNNQLQESPYGWPFPHSDTVVATEKAS